MVKGLARFREHFAAYTDCYVLIGGTASSLSIEELGGDFRATKDLDIVLCVEALDREFAEAFRDFIRQGQYENRQKSTGKVLFYRFYSPAEEDFPEMLELFSKVPDALDLQENAEVTPVPIDEQAASLSAILMDDAYYAFVMENKTMIDGLSVVKAEALIPLKARAYVDLSNRKAAGEQVDSKNIKKHKNDIFRLFSVLDPASGIVLGSTLQTDLAEAFSRFLEDPPDLKSLGISRMTLADVLDEMHRFYQLPSSPEKAS